MSFWKRIKNTSLATIIALPELLNHAQSIYDQDVAFILPIFLIISVVYFTVCYVLSVLSQFSDGKLAKKGSGTWYYPESTIVGGGID